MRNAAKIAVASIAVTVFGTCGNAHAGDAARGDTLFHATYGCNECHGDNPGPAFAPNLTGPLLLNVIKNVPPMRNRFLASLGQSATDLADIAAWLASLGAAQAQLDIDQHGLTGSWYEAATTGQGVEVEFFPDLVAPGTALVQGAWFTFDVAPRGGADRERWYTFSGNAVRGQTSVPITLYRNVGGNFNAPPVTSATAVGSGTLAFTDCDNGTLTYQFTDGSGRSGTVALTRLLKNVTCAVGPTPPVSADFALSGNWFDAATSGQGIVVEVNPALPYFFLTWYTYAPSGQAAGAAGQRWFTAQAGYAPGSRTITATIFETTGGIFDQAANPAPATDPVGVATITFASCASAHLQFNFTAGSDAGKAGTIALARIGPVPPGCAR
jgi:hypothetical protein